MYNVLAAVQLACQSLCKKLQSPIELLQKKMQYAKEFDNSGHWINVRLSEPDSCHFHRSPKNISAYDYHPDGTDNFTALNSLQIKGLSFLLFYSCHLNLCDSEESTCCSSIQWPSLLMEYDSFVIETEWN